jgi:hypothetical protein
VHSICKVANDEQCEEPRQSDARRRRSSRTRVAGVVVRGLAQPIVDVVVLVYILSCATSENLEILGSLRVRVASHHST